MGNYLFEIKIKFYVILYTKQCQKSEKKSKRRFIKWIKFHFFKTFYTKKKRMTDDDGS